MNHGNLEVDDDVMEIESDVSGVGMAGTSNPGLGGARPCTDRETTPVMGIKRKCTIPSPTSIGGAVRSRLRLDWHT